MIGHIIAELALKNSSISKSFYFDSNNQPKSKDNIKGLLIDECASHEYEINNRLITIDVKSDEYTDMLISDYYFCNERINKQKENINNLLKSNSQVAWILISTYYCNFFIANEISKIYGQFIINFSREDMVFMLRHSNCDNPEEFERNIDDYNNSYRLVASQSEYENFVKLTLCKSSPKPHQSVWKNLLEIINKLGIRDEMRQHKELLKCFLDQSDKKWSSPNTIRNEWNYKYASYYSDDGEKLGEIFLKLLKDSSSSFKWAGNRTIHPITENQVASIAYIYHVLNEAHTRINYRLGL